MTVLFANNAASTLAQDLEDWQTVIDLTTGDGALFPQPSSAEDFFPLTLSDASDGLEIVHVTARDGDQLTVLRGRESTIPRSFLTGDAVELRLTAGALDAMLQAAHVDAASTSVIKNARFVAADQAIIDHGDPSVEGSLAWAVAQVGSGRGDVLLPGSHTFALGRDLSVPEGVRLVFGRDAVLDIAPAVSLTLDGPIGAGPYRIFSGDGTVTGSAGHLGVLPQWWGARGDGQTDDTAALSAALSFRQIRIPAGTYLVSAALPLNAGTSVSGLAAPPASMDWSADHETFTPSFHGRVAVLQRLAGSHGALFAAADSAHFENVVFRCGEIRTEQDRFFDAVADRISLARCRFENLHRVLAEETPGTAWGRLEIRDCAFAGCHIPFKGALTDSSLSGCTFAGCDIGLDLETGAGRNTVTSCRFEDNRIGLQAREGGANIVSSCVFDAHSETALKLHADSHNRISACTFLRNGTDGTDAEKRSHIVIKETSLHNVVEGNAFLAGGPDGSSTKLWPRHILELVSCPDTMNIFQANSTIDGCVEMPVKDPWWTSTDSLLADDFHIKSIGYPGESGDQLIEIVKQIDQVVAGPVNVHLYEDRNWTVHTDLRGDRIRLVGHGPVTLTDTTGKANRLASISSITYGRSFAGTVSLMKSPLAPNQGYWTRGSVCFNSDPASGEPVGWICVSDGSPGLWYGFGTIY